MQKRISTCMYSIQERNLVRDRVLQLASSDPRVVAGAVVGSLALGEGDRWSDLDLTFAVADDISMFDVLEDWTRTIVTEFDAIHLFDLPSGTTIYRVFLLPGCLQFDLSCTPAADFGALGPKFRLLFGETVARPFAPRLRQESQGVEERPRPLPGSTRGAGAAPLDLHQRGRARRADAWAGRHWENRERTASVAG